MTILPSAHKLLPGFPHRLARCVRTESAARQLTPDALAAASGLPLRTVARIREGNIDITVGDLARLARGLDMSPADLFDVAWSRAPHAHAEAVNS